MRVSAYYCLSDDVPTGITAFRCLERASVVRQRDSGQDGKGYRLLLCRKSRRRIFWGFYEAGSRAFRLWRAGSLRREKDHRLRNARKSLKEARPASESAEFGLPNWDLAVRFDTRQAAAPLGLEKGLASDFSARGDKSDSGSEDRAGYYPREDGSRHFCFVQVPPALVMA